MFNKSRLFLFYYKEHTNMRHFQEVSNRTKYYFTQSAKQRIACRERECGRKQEKICMKTDGLVMKIL